MRTTISFHGIQISVEALDPVNTYTDFGSVEGVAQAITYLNPYISSDYHFLRERLKPNEGIKARVEREIEIIRSHNKYIGPNDVCMLLGDMSESEFSEDTSIQAELKILLKALNGKKILIRGNNDTLPDEFYKECGFVYICDVIKTDKYIFSHKPVDVTGDLINIHGHLHGNKQYWDIDGKRHIDVYWDTNDKRPHRLSEFIAFYNAGRYSGNTTVLSEEYRISDHV